MNQTRAFRPPQLSDRCADPALIRRFTLVKLLILLLGGSILILIIVLRPHEPHVVAPSHAPPPPVILAGELQLEGLGSPGSSIELLANDKILGSSLVTSTGRWALATTFPAGQYHLLAQAMLAEDEPLSGPDGRTDLTVVDPPTLEISAPRPRGKTAAVVLFGQGTPGSTLRLLWNEETIATIEVPTPGEWQFPLATVPVPSENAFAAQVLDPAGAVLGRSAPRELSLLAPAPLAIEHATFGHLVRNRQLNLIDGELQATGTGEPEAQITLWRDQTVITPATIIAADGTWALAVPRSLPPGEHPFRVRMAAADDRVLEEATNCAHR